MSIWDDYDTYGSTEFGMVKASPNAVRCNICHALVYDRYLNEHMKVHVSLGQIADPIMTTIKNTPELCTCEECTRLGRKCVHVRADSSKEEQSSLKRNGVVSGSTQRTSRTGRRTLSDIVENVVFIGENRELYQAITGKSMPEHKDRSYGLYPGYSIYGDDPYNCRWREQPIPIDKSTADASEPIEINGWTVHRDTVQVGRKKALRAHRLTSGDTEVYAVNISEDHTRGWYNLCKEYCILSPNREAVVSFLKDFDIHADIEDMDSICQST